MNQPTSGPTTMLELRNVHKRFGATEIIQGINLTIGRGEHHALIGPNGAGKSATFNLISNRFPTSSGNVRLNGEGISGLVPFRINRKGLSRSFQITNVFHRLSVFENLRCMVPWSLDYKYSFWHKLTELCDARERTEEVLKQTGMTHRCEAAVGLLTCAEQRVLGIGITIVGDADVILLDGPTAGMSRSEFDHTVELIRRVTVGKTLVMVEHDMSVVFGLADRISVLVCGEVIAANTPEAIHNGQCVKEAYLGTTLDGPAGAH